jgi:hypothetical protein
MKVWDLQEPHVGRVLQSLNLGQEASGLSCVGDTAVVGTVDGEVKICKFARVLHQAVRELCYSKRCIAF